MSYLIISTLSKSDDKINDLFSSLSSQGKNVELVSTESLNLSSCRGCSACWLKTPGICAIKDDWETLFRKFVKSDTVILVTEAKLGFVSYKLKNIIDRLIPLALPYLEIYKGEMRHTRRYKKRWNVALVYSGEGDRDFLTEWMERVTLNFFSKSLGVYNIEEYKGLFHELDHI